MGVLDPVIATELLIKGLMSLNPPYMFLNFFTSIIYNPNHSIVMNSNIQTLIIRVYLYKIIKPNNILVLYYIYFGFPRRF